MRCPFLSSSEKGLVCGKSLSGMSPDDETKERYCEGDDSFRCPILLAFILRGGQKRSVEKYHNVSVRQTL